MYIQMNQVKEKKQKTKFQKVKTKQRMTFPQAQVIAHAKAYQTSRENGISEEKKQHMY